MLFDKSILRARLREARATISDATASVAAHKIAALALPFIKTLSDRAPAETPVALYNALPGELDCLPLLQSLSVAGYKTLLPVAGPKATPLTFRLWKPGDPLSAGRFGLREPEAEAPEMIPKILFAPLLGFDGKGGRLGFGGGYYDATLAHLRKTGLIAAGGLAFAVQKIDAIPMEAHDEALDFVVTEDNLFDFRLDR
jgi:5-formyltetrahydrofolate cyclo-ligase